MPRTRYPCRWTGCQNVYDTVEGLFDHLCDDHVGRRATNNLCLTCYWNDCGATAAKRDHLTSHVKVHLPFKPFVCQQCRKPFKRPQDLKKHEKTHTIEHQASLISNQPGYKPVRRRRHKYDKSNVKDCNPKHEDVEMNIDDMDDLTSGNPLQDLIQAVLKDDSLPPDYNIEMMRRLNSISHIIQQKDEWTLAVPSDQAHSMQMWLEQLSANIQTDSCLYPGMAQDDGFGLGNHLASDLIEPYTDLAPASTAASVSGNGKEDIHPPSLSLYPSPTSHSLSNQSSPAAYPWSPLVSTPEAAMGSYPSSAAATSPSLDPGLLMDIATAPIDQSLYPSFLAATAATLPTLPQPQSDNSAMQADSTPEASQPTQILAKFWNPGSQLSVVHSQPLSGPTPAEEIDFTPNSFPSPIPASPDMFETEQVAAPSQPPVSHDTYRFKKEMMHMVNVFAAPQEKGIAGHPPPSSSATSSPPDATTDNVSTGSNDAVTGTSAVQSEPVHLDSRANEQPNDADADGEERDDHDDEDSDDSDGSSEADEETSPYASLTEALDGLTIGPAQEAVLRQRHAKVVEMLWKATQLTLSTSSTKPAELSQ